MVTRPTTSRDPERLKGQGHDPNTFMAKYLENSWKCLFRNNQLLDLQVCCEAVRSTILTTAWLLFCII